MSRFNVILFYVVCMIFGMYLVRLSWGGLDFVFLNDARLPASFKGASVSMASEYEFSSRSELRRTTDGFEVYLNQFVVRDHRDLKTFVCQVDGHTGAYNRVELRLMGLGISEAGRVPRLYIEADCKSQPSATKIGAIRVFIPMAEIVGLKPVDQELKWYDGDNTLIRVVDMVSEWPTEWRLEDVTYKDHYQANPNLTLTVPPLKDESKSLSNKAVTLIWQPGSAE